MKITVEIQEDEHVQDLMDAYSERIQKSASRAINKSAKGLQAEVSKTIMKSYVIRRKDLQPSIRRTLSHAREIFAEVNIRGNKVPLDRFKHSPTVIRKKRPVGGVKVWIKKGSSIIQKGSFLALLRKGEGDKPRIYERKGKKRWPLIRPEGPAVSDMLDGGDIQTLQSSTKERFFRYFEHEMTKGFKYNMKRKK